MLFDVFFSCFVVSYSAGSHGGAAKVQQDLATAECKLQCVSYIECVLLTWQSTFLQTLKASPSDVTMCA